MTVWLNAELRDRVQLSYLVTPTDAAAVNCFDVRDEIIVLASDNQMVTIIDNCFLT
jgi:hypothetical protein